MSDLNTNYFGGLFQRTMGISFNRYLTQTRVKNAENMLGSGEYNMLSVAEACGFTNALINSSSRKRLSAFPRYTKEILAAPTGYQWDWHIKQLQPEPGKCRMPTRLLLFISTR